MIDIKGMGVALITPFTKYGEVDYDSLGNIVELQVESNADFICILCTTSEYPTLSDKEKRNIKNLVIGVVNGRIPIVMGCGGNCTASVINEIEKGDFKGIDAILSVVPYYNKPSQEGIYQHFSTIANVSPVPIILYNVPGRVGVNMTSDVTLRLAKENKNIIAIKEASGNIQQIDEIIKNKPKEFVVLSGDDSMTLPIMSLGGEGVISVIGNAYPREYTKMVHLILNKDFDKARIIHQRFEELYPLLFVDGNPAGIKAVLNTMGLCENVLRLPLVKARNKTIDMIQKKIKDLSAIAI